jgi:hypothetical protein
VEQWLALVKDEDALTQVIHPSCIPAKAAEITDKTNGTASAHQIATQLRK